MAPAWALHGDTSPASQPGLLCPWVHRFSQNLLHCGLSMGVTASFAHPCASMCGILHSRQVDLCLIHNGSPWDTGAQLSRYCLYHRLQENLFSNAWNTYWPFFFTGLSVCWAFSLFSLGLLLLLHSFIPLLEYIIPEVLPLSLRSIALASAYLRAIWHFLHQTQGKLLTEANLCSALTTKPQINPITDAKS